MIRSTDRTSGPIAAQAPARERQPRQAAVLTELFVAGGIQGRSSFGSGKVLGPGGWAIFLVIVCAAAVALGFWDLHRGRAPAPEPGPFLASLTFFPGVARLILLIGLIGGLWVWHPSPRHHLHSMPLPRRTHELLLVAAMGMRSLLMAAVVLLAGGVYAVVIGQPGRYVAEAVALAPMALTGAVILYLLMAALALRTRYAEWKPFAVLLLAGVTSALLEPIASSPTIVGRVAGHLLFVFGLLPPERLVELAPDAASFPYGLWLPAAMAWLAVSLVVLYRAAGHYREDA